MKKKRKNLVKLEKKQRTNDKENTKNRRRTVVLQRKPVRTMKNQENDETTREYRK